MEKAIKRYWPVFLLPTLAAFVIGFIIPFIQGVYLSFCQFTTVRDASFIGFSNFTRALADTTFSHAFWYNCAFVVVSTLAINLGGLCVALILTRELKGRNAYRTVFFMPNLIGGIVLGYIWQILLNCALSLMKKPLLALDATAGFWGLVILMCWQQIGYMMIIYIAGLQSVSDDMIEAAKIDGANGWHILGNITIPTVMPSITICTFLTLTNGFKLFDQNLVLTGGQPFTFQPDGTIIRSTEMLALNIYNTFYLNSNSRGMGQAKAVLFFILVAAIALIQLRATHSREVQQ